MNELRFKTSHPTFTRSCGASLAVAALLGAVACGGGSAANSGGTGDGELDEIVIAEPMHGIGYLPLYIAIDEGIFEENGLEVSTSTQSSGGGAHVNFVLSGQGWGFIGGPEHNGYVMAEDEGQSMEVKAVANVVNKGNVYLLPRAGVDAPEISSLDEVAELFEGSTVVTQAYGGTPNSITRHLIEESGLTLDDVELIEAADAAAPMTIIAEGQADYAVSSDPIIQQGIDEGVWEEPILSVPEMLGDYAYSTINVPTATYEEDPELAQRFVDSISEALEIIHNDRETAEAVAVDQFSNLDEDMILAVLERSYEDELWPEDATITEEATSVALEVARGAGTLDDGDDPATYEDVVDMQFVDGAE